MLIDQKTMDKIHDIQYEMLKELIRVMDLLNVRYFFVHGSLLGAIRDNDFIAQDDDIDIAVFREDYNKLMYYGQALMSPRFFLQNSVNDKFPLSFGKMRRNDTAFIQPVLNRIDCNKGIYIDIFPLDYENNSLFFHGKKLLLEARIFQELDGGRIKWRKKLLGMISKAFCISYYRALLKREVMFSSSRKSELLVIHGGKTKEKHMPIEWFEQQVYFKFRDIKVSCPFGYALYLQRIYGDEYLSYNPAGKRIDDNRIEISAEILDFGKSYLDYQG